jgi:hypothetical protein
MDVKKHVPQIYLEQLHLNELSPERVKSMNESSSEKLDKDMKSIELSNKEILEQYPPAFIKERIIRRMDSENKTDSVKSFYRSNILKFAPIAAALVILTINLAGLRNTQQVDDIIRSKGLTPELSVYIDENNSPEELFNNDFVSESDLIQLTYNAAGNRYGIIFSIDGRGVLTLHYPEDKNITPLIDPNGSHALPFSYELDDAPGFERFFFVSSKNEFDIDTVLDSAESVIQYGSAATLETLELTTGFDQQTIILKKD